MCIYWLHNRTKVISSVISTIQVLSHRWLQNKCHYT